MSNKPPQEVGPSDHKGRKRTLILHFPHIDLHKELFTKRPTIKGKDFWTKRPTIEGKGIFLL